MKRWLTLPTVEVLLLRAHDNRNLLLILNNRILVEALRLRGRHLLCQVHNKAWLVVERGFRPHVALLTLTGNSMQLLQVGLAD